MSDAENVQLKCSASLSIRGDGYTLPNHRSVTHACTLDQGHDGYHIAAASDMRFLWRFDA